MRPNVQENLVGGDAAATPPPLKLVKKGPKGGLLRRRNSISNLLLVTVLITISLAGGIAGVYALNIVYQNKLTDTWAILFLDLESRGNRLVQTFETFQNELENQAPDALLRARKDGKFEKIRGSLPETLTAADLHLAKPKLTSRWSVLQIAGENFLTTDVSENEVARWVDGSRMTDGRYFLMRKLDLAHWFNPSSQTGPNNTLYLLSKEGLLLYSNDPAITQNTYMKRSLIQSFIAAPLSQGQMEFDREDGKAFGFFYEVPHTNVIFFVETKKSEALASVTDIAIRYTVTLLFILSLAGILLQFRLNALVAPIKELVRLAGEIGEGNFKIKPRLQGYGELKVLSQSFVEMSQSLTNRDEKINALLVEQQEKFRLAGELSIAKSIQDNFLLKTPLPPESGLVISAQYIPATEVAGDWYGYFYNEVNGEVVAAIADVSGHGAGSAMFTAIIASAFEEARAQANPKESFPIEEFVHRLNRLILRLGRGTVHATMIVSKYRRETGEVVLVNAGHPSPVYFAPPEESKKPEVIMQRSDLLGISLEFKSQTNQLKLPKRGSLLMYTDGLTEGSPDRRIFSERKILKLASPSPPLSAAELVERVHEAWLEHLKGQQSLDDLCLLALMASV